MFTVPGDATSILLSDLGIVLVVVALAKLLHPERTPDRALLGAITLLSILIYAFWRTLDTLPPFDWSVASLWPRVFYGFEMLAILYSSASILILMRTSDRSRLADAAQARLEASGQWPEVDVFICTYNEPLNVLEKSIFAALDLDYPNHRVFVCDDTRREPVREHCGRFGAFYVTRPDNRHAKAGNLNNALRVSGEDGNGAPLILVLDADFAPQSHYLKRVVGLFEDRRIGVVQTPQFYYNCDPIQQNLGLRDSFVDDQRVFFDTFQPSKDAVDCAFCVGTSFVVRRDLVTEMGGFPHEALSEDMLLTYRLMERGYVTRWLNERLSVGLSAEGLPEYITQRTRWCLGTIQIGVLRDGPLLGGRFTLLQRLHYIHGLLSWLAKPFIILMMVAPVLYWFFELPAFEADHLAFLRYGLPALIVFWIYSSWVSGKRTLPLFTEVTHALTALPITLTLLSALRNPFGKPFKVTEKGGDRSVVKVNVGMAAMFGGLALASAVAIVINLLGPVAQNSPSDRDLFNLIWAGVAMVISLLAFIVCFERPREGDGEELIRVHETVYLLVDGMRREAKMVALSVDRIVFAEALSMKPAEGLIHIEGVGAVQFTSDGDSVSVLPFRTDDRQRQALVRKLFSSAPVNVASRGQLFRSITASIRHALWS
ncbi:beta 1,3 glucan synthase catalytic subunit [Fulvimarina pelagi HTCC2506]|uniref:Beta 1,3 glucan synthase catalytic subunit n=1 Tax=Fulvimarina pelagi HTCC2506 TaxID=314231 RepID=Q0FXH3_9HYPH|nr:beta 1,3 glucan synthase catalytic subunit [Fulvimarina pelagi HTCC2506]